MTKKTFTPNLNYAAIRAKTREELRVRTVTDMPVPVIVKGMTAADRHLLGEMNGRRLNHFFGDNDNAPAPEFMHSGQTIIAALCAIDENGDLVFGRTPREAIQTVSSLPAHYSEMIMRIVFEALKLGGGETDAVGVENAEKN